MAQSNIYSVVKAFSSVSDDKKKVVYVLGEFEGEIIAPQSTRRKGPEPAIVKETNFGEEMKFVAKQMKRLREERNVPYSEMLILYRVKRTHKQSIIDVIKRTLEKEQIPYYWLAEDETTKRKFSRDEETVKISTIESSKGLDFQAVFIVNVDNMPFALEEDREREVSLLYIGMTRAKEYLCLSYSGESEFTRYFEQVRTSRLQKKKEENVNGS